MAYTTKKSLLEAIRGGDEISWREFYETYRPLIALRARDCKLNSAETDELIQGVMLQIFAHRQTFVYDRSRGRFRDYLGVMIRHAALNLIRSRRKNEVGCEELEEIDSAHDEDRWLAEWRQHLLTQALKQLRGELEATTFQAFELYVLREQPAKNVAKFLQIPVSSVYVAKNRALIRLRRIIRLLSEAEQ